MVNQLQLCIIFQLFSWPNNYTNIFIFLCCRLMRCGNWMNTIQSEINCRWLYSGLYLPTETRERYYSAQDKYVGGHAAVKECTRLSAGEHLVTPRTWSNPAVISASQYTRGFPAGKLPAHTSQLTIWELAMRQTNMTCHADNWWDSSAPARQNNCLPGESFFFQGRQSV